MVGTNRSTSSVGLRKVSSGKLEARMREGIRKTGIDIIGDAPWGTHLCQFYQTKEDLIDILVPYFKAGLENNEFCMWVTSEPLNKKEAEIVMRKAVPNFDQYLERGQIEITPYNEWYIKDGAFNPLNPQRVLNAWIDKLNEALTKGYGGMRVTGNTAWLEKRDWGDFTDYEEEINNAIGKYRMMAICTYSLDKCVASEVIDVVHNHQFALIRRAGNWVTMESYERKRTEEQLLLVESAVKASVSGVSITDLSGKLTYVNPALVDMFGYNSLLKENVTKIDIVKRNFITYIHAGF